VAYPSRFYREGWVAVACSFAFCGCLAFAVAFIPWTTTRSVISTEVDHSLILICEVEKPALSEVERDPRFAFAFAVACSSCLLTHPNERCHPERSAAESKDLQLPCRCLYSLDDNKKRSRRTCGCRCFALAF
jgi:hypothetical protein